MQQSFTDLYSWEKNQLQVQKQSIYLWFIPCKAFFYTMWLNYNMYVMKPITPSTINAHRP